MAGSAGGRVWSDDRSRSTLDEPAFVRPWQWYADLIHVERVSPPAEAWDSLMNAHRALEAGRIAMTLRSGWVLDALRRDSAGGEHAWSTVPAAELGWPAAPRAGQRRFRGCRRELGRARPPPVTWCGSWPPRASTRAHVRVFQAGYRRWMSRPIAWALPALSCSMRAKVGADQPSTFQIHSRCRTRSSQRFVRSWCADGRRPSRRRRPRDS